MARKMSQSSKDKLNAYYEEIGVKRKDKEDEGKPSPSSAASKPSASSNSGSGTTTSKRKMSQDSWNKLSSYHSGVGADAPAYTPTRITSFNANDLQSWQDDANRFVQQVSDDYRKRDGVWQESTAMDRYRTSTTATARDLQTRANAFADYLTNNRDQYDAETVDAILSSLNEQSSWLGELGTSLDSEYDYWSQWKTAQEYDDYQRGMSIDIVETEIKLEGLKREQEYLPFKYGESPEYLVISEQVEEQIAALEKDLELAKKVQHPEAAPLDNGAPWYEKLWASAKRGYLGSKLGTEGWKEMSGQANNAEMYSDILAGEEYQFEPDKWWEKAVYGAAELGGQLVEQTLDPTPWAMGLGAAGAATIAGQVGPQVLAPEEVITVPGAFAAGYGAGMAGHSAKVEGGHAYYEMLEMGISPETAAKYATVVGGVNGAIEAMQVDELFDMFKIAQKTNVDESILRRIIRELYDRGVLGTVKETSQELGQEIVTMAGVSAANKQEKGEWAYAASDWGSRLGEVGISSALMFGLTGVAGAGVNVSGNVALNKAQTAADNKAAGTSIVEMGDDVVRSVIEEGLAAAPGSDRHALAKELQAQLDSGKKVNQQKLGMLYRENVKTYKEDNVEEVLSRTAREAVASENAEATPSTLADAAREAVGAEESNVSAEADTTDTRAENAVPYNVMANNPTARANRFVLDTTGYGEHGDKTFRELVDSDTTGRDVRQMREAFDPFYQAGMAGVEIAQFGNAEQRIAYNAGKQDAIAAQGNANRIAAAQKGHKTVGIQDSEAAKKIASADANVINTFAQALNMPVFAQETVAALGDEAGAEGETTPTGEVILAMDSYAPGDLTTFFHEGALHRMRQLAPTETDAVINAIVSASLKNTAYSGKANVNAVAAIRKRYTDQGGFIPVDIAMEEVAAETIGGMFGKNPERATAILNDVMGELEAEAKRNGKTDAEAKAEAKNTWERFVQWLHETIAKLKAYFNKNKGTMDAETKAGFQAAINDLTETEQLWKDALKASVQKAQELSGITASEAFADTSAEAQAERIELSDALTRHSLRKKAPPKKTGIAYKVFVVKDGKLYPPMVANPGGEGTPVGVWLDADAGKIAGYSKEGRPQVESGGKGTNAAKGMLAYRPGWHLGDIPHATQFAKVDKDNRVQAVDKDGKPKFDKQGKPVWAKTAFPKNFVWAECEYAMDVDYQEEAMSYGYTANGKFRHSYAGLPKLPTDGFYRYRTNPNPGTVPWVITGAMKVNRILTDAETDAICRENGVEPMPRLGGPIDLAKYGLTAQKNTTDGSGVDGSNPYKGKSLTADSDVYSYDFLVNLPDMEVKEMPLLSEVKTGDKVDQQKAIDLGMKNAAEVGRKVSQNVCAVTNAYTGREIRVSQNGLGHSLDGGNVGRLRTNARLTAIGGDIIRNAVPMNALNSTNPQARGTYAMAALLKSGDLDVVAIVTVEQYTDRVTGIDYVDIAHSINGRLDAKKEGSRSSTRETGTNPATASFSISITDFLEIVNNTHRSILSEDVLSHFGETKSPDGYYSGKTRFSLKDSTGKTLSKGQQEYFKDSKVRDKDGNLLVVYHGTDADFHVFDFLKAGKNGKMEGYGFYFSDDQEITGRYGEIQKEVYLNITKPLYNNKRTIKKAELVKLTNAMIDYDLEKYKDDGLVWQDSFISNYVNTYEFNMSRRYAVQEFVNQVWEYNNNDQDLVFELARGDGLLYSADSAQEFYGVLKESIGYDGIIAEWSHADGTSNVYVTFDSKQSKYTTNDTPTTSPDMRYSLKNPTDKKAVGALGKGANVVADKQGDLLLAANKDKSTSLYSIKTYKDGGRKKLESMLRQKGHSDAEIADTLSLIDDASDYLMMLAADYAKSHGYKVLADHLQASVVTNVKTGRQAMSVMVSNGDYPVNIDTTLTCKKRDAYMKLMTQLVDDGIFDQVTFGGEAIAKVNEILRANGFETACLGCFVESRRLQFQSWANTIVREWNAEVDARTDNAESFSFGKDDAALSDEDISALQKELKGAGKKNAQGNLNLGKGSVREKMGRLLDKVPSLRKHLTTADLLTPKGLAALRAYDPNLFSLVKSRYGAASPKIVQDFTPYASELADLTFAAVKNITFKAVKGAGEYTNRVKREMGGTPTKKAGESANEFKARKAEFNKQAEEEAMRRYLYDIGGVRIQSFSDFMIENVFDYLQIFADLAAGEFPLHGYSKEAICLRLFGMTGAKWNGSWIAHVDKSLGKEFAGLLPASEAKNGNALLVRVDGKEYAIGMDDYARNKATNGETFVQSVGMKDMIALMLDPRYSSNVGSITIGVSDKQILAMLDSPLFSMVIPYHASGMLPQFAKLVGVDLYNDYTDYQNTTVKEWFDAYGNKVDALRDKDGSLVSVDTSYNFNAEFQKTGDAKKAASNYLAWCAKMHPVVVNGERIGYVTYSPKFSNSPYGTDFTKHKNYYKLLEDFTSYDSISGAAAVQGAVTMNFPSETNRLTSAQMDAYKAALRATGVFTEKDIEKYAATANKTFKELIAGEVKGRAEYKVAQDAKWETTYGEVKDLLRSEFNPNGSVFSLKRNKTVEQENAELRETIAALKEQFTITKFAKPDKKAVSALASALAKEYNSKTDVSAVAAGLADMFDMMNNQVESLVNTYGDAWYSVVTSKAEGIAESILRESVEVDAETHNTYRNLRQYLREQRITLDPSFEADLSGYESIAQFKRAYKGKIRLVNDGAPVSEVYQELAGMFPGLFNEEEHSDPAGQLLHIAEVLDDISSFEFNPYEGNMDGAVSWLATDIIDRAYHLAKAKPTFADKAAAQMSALREQKNARIQELVSRHRDQTRSAVLKERAKQEQKIKKLKDTVSDLEAMVKAYKKADRNAAVEIDSEILKVYQSDPTVFRAAMLQIDPKDRAVVREAYDKLIEEHGAIKPGENPAREVQVPKKTADGKKVSQTVRTVMEAAATPEDALPTIEQMVADGYFSYDVYTDKEAIADAKLQIDRKTLPIAFAEWVKDVESGIVSKQHTVLGWALYNYAVNAKETATAMKVLSLMVKHQRNAAQALQATRVLKQLSPEAQMYEAQLTVERINEDLARREQARIFKAPGKKKPPASANLPVEEWMEKTGELLTEKLVSRTKTPTAKAKTTAQIILDDLWKVASKKVKAAKRVDARRSNMDVIEDLFNNQEEFQRAWDAAKAHLEEQYGDNPAVMEALEEWKNSALDYHAAFSSEVAGKYNVQIDPKLIDKFYAQKDQAGRDEVMKDIYRNIGSQLPSTFADKWNAWRYMAMLGNVRTHVRNVLGNAGFAPVVLAKDTLAAGIESVVSRVTHGKLNRTKAGIVFSKSDRALLAAAWADFKNIRDLLDGGLGKDNANPNKYIEEGRRIFPLKPLEKARRFSGDSLETEDMWFSQPHYAYAMLQYCKAHNITAEQIARGKAIDPARAYAMKEAQKATYRDANAFSNFVSRIGRTSDAKNPAGKVMRGLIEGVLPFRRTPANILVRGLEYSPLGLLKSLSYDLVQVKKFANTNGEQGISGAQMIDNLSAGLTGSALLGLGVWLAAQGLLRGHGDDDEKEKEFEELMGHQAYSLELPDGTSITLDWLAPEALPFFVGVNLYEATRGSDKEITMEALLSSLFMVTEPMLEMSMLQGLNDMIESVGYNKSNGIVAMATSALTSYLTQGLPTLTGQIDRTMQSERMTTYTDKNNKWLTAGMQRFAGKFSQKVPFVDFFQIPYVDAWGRKESSGKLGARAANNMLNPAYTSKVNESEMEKELLRLYDATGEDVFPALASKDFTVDKVEKLLTGDEYVKYATAKGQNAYKLVTDLTQSREYKALDDAEKVDAVQAAYDMANQLAKADISNFKPDKWVTEAQNSRKLGMTTSEFIVAKVKYGTDNLTTETAQEMVDAGVDIDEYLDFRTELSAAEKANGDENVKQAEFVDMILDRNLSDDDNWALFFSKSNYDSKNARAAESHGISFELFTTVKQELENIHPDYRRDGTPIPDSRKPKVERYLRTVCSDAKEYLFLLGMEFESTRKDRAYIAYFGREDD